MRRESIKYGKILDNWFRINDNERPQSLDKRYKLTRIIEIS